MRVGRDGACLATRKYPALNKHRRWSTPRHMNSSHEYAGFCRTRNQHFNINTLENFVVEKGAV